MNLSTRFICDPEKVVRPCNRWSWFNRCSLSGCGKNENFSRPFTWDSIRHQSPNISTQRNSRLFPTSPSTISTLRNQTCILRSCLLRDVPIENFSRDVSQRIFFYTKRTNQCPSIYGRQYYHSSTFLLGRGPVSQQFTPHRNNRKKKRGSNGENFVDPFNEGGRREKGRNREKRMSKREENHVRKEVESCKKPINPLLRAIENKDEDFETVIMPKQQRKDLLQTKKLKSKAKRKENLNQERSKQSESTENPNEATKMEKKAKISLKTPPNGDRFFLFVSCLPGLEPLLQREVIYLQRQWHQLSNLESNSTSIKPSELPKIIAGGVELSVPSVTHIYILHLYLGTASHIYWRLNDGLPDNSKQLKDPKHVVSDVPPMFSARGFPELQRKLKLLMISGNWSKWMGIDSSLDSRNGKVADESVEKKNASAMRQPWKLVVNVHCSKSKLMHTKAVEERVRQTISEVLGIDLEDGSEDLVKSSGASNDNIPILHLLVRLEHDLVQLSLDTFSSAKVKTSKCKSSKDKANSKSSPSPIYQMQPMHRRGYKLSSARAPLREDLSFALLLAGGLWPRWDLRPFRSLLANSDENQDDSNATLNETNGADIELESDRSVSESSLHLLDPFCGSGTIVIEGAGILARLPPGRFRPAPLLGTTFHNADLWDDMKQRALSESISKDGFIKKNIMIAGSDRDKGAIASARKNAKRAGVKGLINFTCKDFSDHPWLDFSRTSKRATTDMETLGSEGAQKSLFVVANPPYGKRISSNHPLSTIYQKLGRVLSSRKKKSTCYAFMGDNPRELRKSRLPLNVAFSSKHGGLPVVAMVGQVNTNFETAENEENEDDDGGIENSEHHRKEIAHLQE